jgi:hypothetical protein
MSVTLTIEFPAIALLDQVPFSYTFKPAFFVATNNFPPTNAISLI